eukprot:TRINITY_DN8787_c1_g1_i1.p1 TRINITY_DN8787_c1_g1~~TRINITY_DN8787_c1_g1_i1.p1  ORF type:complete len:281 (+),score=108.64 TRINITY_DN8787_c1_g1_i1:44-886(+)
MPAPTAAHPLPAATGDRRLNGRLCVITGASQGIGRGIAEVFAAHGGKLALLDIASLEETRAAIRGAGRPDPLCLKCDISVDSEVKAAVEQVSAHYGGQAIHALVNNACRFVFKGVVEATPEDWDASLGVNVKGTALVQRHVVPKMATDGKASIVNIASISAYVSQYSMATYNATKAAILQMTRNAALDLWNPYRVRVNAVCPGAILTPATYSHYEATKRTDPGLTFEDFVKNMNGGIIDRLGDVKEVAAMVLFLAGDEGSFCTGGSFLVDGGWTCCKPKM